jgi:hypothetical protein
LGPLGLFIVAVFWLMALSGNIPAGSSPAPKPETEKTYVEEEVVPLPDLAQNPVTSYPASLPTGGTGT